MVLNNPLATHWMGLNTTPSSVTPGSSSDMKLSDMSQRPNGQVGVGMRMALMDSMGFDGVRVFFTVDQPQWQLNRVYRETLADQCHGLKMVKMLKSVCAPGFAISQDLESPWQALKRMWTTTLKSGPAGRRKADVKSNDK